MLFFFFFFFKQKTAYEMRISDWSSDVCSSDLLDGEFRARLEVERTAQAVHQIREIIRRQDRGRAAAPVQAVDRPAFSKHACEQIDLPAQQAHVGGDAQVVAGHRSVAAAVPAELMAERNVEIER